MEILRHRYLIIISLSSCLLLAICAGMFFVASYYQIQKVQIISKTPISSSFSDIKGKSIFFFDTQAYELLLRKKFPIYKSIKVVKSYPNMIIISYDARVPVVYSPHSPEPIFFDEQGYLLASSAGAELKKMPRIEVSKFSVSASGQSDWRVIKSIQFITIMQKQGIFIDHVRIDDEASVFHLYLVDDTECIIPFKGSPGQIASSLQIIISRFRIEGKSLKSINFQFDKPVVVLSNGEKNTSK